MLYKFLHIFLQVPSALHQARGKRVPLNSVLCTLQLVGMPLYFGFHQVSSLSAGCVCELLSHSSIEFSGLRGCTSAWDPGAILMSIFLFVVTVLVLQWVPAFRPPYFQPTIPCLGCWRLFVFSVHPFKSILYSSHQEWFPKSQTSSLQSFVLTELLLDSNTISCQDCGNGLDTAPAIKNHRLVWEKRESFYQQANKMKVMEGTECCRLTAVRTNQTFQQALTSEVYRRKRRCVGRETHKWVSASLEKQKEEKGKWMELDFREDLGFALRDYTKK